MNEELLKIDDKLRKYIRGDPKSMLAWAYRLGPKDANIENDKKLDVGKVDRCI